MPSIDWDAIDAAIETMESGGLEDVRGHGYDAHTAEIEFTHPAPADWMTTDNVFGSFVEVNTASKVVGYTFRFPGVLAAFPDAPADDSIQVALTAAAEPLGQGRDIDIVGRDIKTSDLLAPHIRGRGSPRPPQSVGEFAESAVAVQDTYFDRVL